MENNTSLQQQLLEAGVHFGHLTRKWNPKMDPYIFMYKNGIKYIDLNKTTVKIDKSIDEVHPADFDALLIPGGFSPDLLREDDRFGEFAKDL